MKKQIIILSFAVLAAVTACGNKDTGEKDSTSKAEEITTTKEVDDAGDSKDGKILIAKLSGKTLEEAIEAGYDFSGYFSSFGDTTLMLDSTTKDEAVDKVIKSLEGMTVAEFVEKYDEAIGFTGFDGQYTFITNVGDVRVSFNLKNGAAAIKAHEDDPFYDLENAEEIQEDAFENVELSSMSLTAELDGESKKKISDLEDVSRDIIEAMASEIVLDKVYYSID